MENVKAYLYDADGRDSEIELFELDMADVNNRTILWVVVTERDEELLVRITGKLGIKHVPCHLLVKEDSPPQLEKFDNLFRFSINSVTSGKHGSPQCKKIDFLVGRNCVLTVSTGEPEYFRQFRKKENGESMIGELDAESLAASLLDQSIVEYFRALDALESRIDVVDEVILKKELDTDKFLQEIVRLRSDTSKLRRWLMPHREVFYALARPDFKQIADSTAGEHFQLLRQHFESAVEAVEHARETVLGVFDLYATKSTHMTNLLIKRLTFLTLITGTLAVIAGVFGMNFRSGLFEAENGFWLTVGGLTMMGVAITMFARKRRWI